MLCIPATSASVERLFSAAGLSACGRRTTIGSALVEAEAVANRIRDSSSDDTNYSHRDRNYVSLHTSHELIALKDKEHMSQFEKLVIIIFLLL